MDDDDDVDVDTAAAVRAGRGCNCLPGRPSASNPSECKGLAEFFFVCVLVRSEDSFLSPVTTGLSL